tara:strand:- start:72 stop:269 length:198 start_codon:yes stop_codon:yes gene_type:complete
VCGLKLEAEMDIFKSLAGVADDVLKTALAPVEVAADMTRIVTKPIADAAEQITEDVKEASKDITD